MGAPIIAPSLLSADPLNFAKDLGEVEALGVDWHHVDVMDGHFVPNLTFGIPLVKALKKFSKLPLDVHIMVSNPDEVAIEYVKAGADRLSFHVEAATHAHRIADSIREAGAKAGVAINPGTPLESLWPLLDSIDQVLVMSVNPGFGGQSFIQNSSSRISDIAAQINSKSLDVTIVVDGGINVDTGAEVVRAGAHALVAGNYIYGADDRAARVKLLKGIGLR